LGDLYCSKCGYKNGDTRRDSICVQEVSKCKEVPIVYVTDLIESKLHYRVVKLLFLV